MLSKRQCREEDISAADTRSPGPPQDPHPLVTSCNFTGTKAADNPPD